MLEALSLLLQIPFIIFLWRLFVSAGEKGWYSLIPIYNIIILLKIVRLKWFFAFFYLLPLIFEFANQDLIFVAYLISGFFTIYLVYRALVCIGKKPYHFMEFLMEMGILSPIIFLVLSTDNLNYDPSRLGKSS
jgi:hypothetical protein